MAALYAQYTFNKYVTLWSFGIEEAQESAASQLPSHTTTESSDVTPETGAIMANTIEETRPVGGPG